MSDELRADARNGFDLRKARENYDAFVARAREHHARTGEWPPDPLLDEIDEIRREIMAEHGNDWRKVLRWHVEQDKLFAQQNPNAKFVERPSKSVGVSGL
jgi:hypothetical protein